MHSIIPQTGEARVDVSSLYSRYAADVVAFVSRWLDPEDRGEAEDLAQDVWLGLWEQTLTGASLVSADELVELAAQRVAQFYAHPVAIEIAVGAVAA